MEARSSLSKTIESCLRKLSNLWLFAFIALLSFVLLSELDQTLEVYRVFALNPGEKSVSIISSILAVFSLSIVLFWLSLENINENDEQANKLIQNISFLLSYVPILSLAIGLIKSQLVFKFEGPYGYAKFFLCSTGILCVLFIIVTFTKRNIRTWLIKFTFSQKISLEERRRDLPNKNKRFFYITPFFELFYFFVILIQAVSNALLSQSPKSDAIKFGFFLYLYIFIYVVAIFYIFAKKPIVIESFKVFFKELLYLEKLRGRIPTPILFIITIFISNIFIFNILILNFVPKDFLLDNYFNLTFAVGPVGIVATFLIALLGLMHPFYIFGYLRKAQLTGFTVIMIPVIMALLFSLFNWNDNHQIRLIPPKEGQQELLSLNMAFDQWKKARQEEIEEFERQKKPYPIYIVSAQGGGIFAAYHAALTLSRLQDLCPAFAQHIFAISGVSGGSLGAATFSSLVKTESPYLNNQGCSLTSEANLEGEAHRLLNHDFLSPVLGAGLLPDFAQRFLPWPIEGFDRARGLEYAFERGWNSIHAPSSLPENLLDQSYYNLWQPDQAAPALVLNTTVVETGERLLISPFIFNIPRSQLPDLADISTVACGTSEHHIDFRLSTAAVLSARFPLVTPVAWFNQCKDRNGNPIKDEHGNSREIRSRLADGGYFENSGFSTAFDIGQRLEMILENLIFEDLKKDQTVEDNLLKEVQAVKDKTFKIVYLALTDNSYLKQEPEGLNELMSPIKALFNSREARGRSIIEQAEYRIDGNKDENISKHQFRQFYLTYAEPNIPVNSFSPNGQLQTNSPSKPPKLPLGWYLSTVSQNIIRNRIGNPDACLSYESSDKANNNSCVIRSIREELSFDDDWNRD